MKAIIISGMPAAGKTTAANIIGKRVGIEAIGIGYILKQMAKEMGFKITHGEGWWDTPEGMRFLKKREEIPDFDKRADKIAMEKADKGDIVITSYTLPWIYKDGIKIWLHGSPAKRAERMAERDNLPVKECVGIVKRRDVENRDLYENIYGFELGKDLKPFDLTIDTDNIPAEKVADIIIEFVKRVSK